MPKISCVIPVYKAEDYIETCLKSIISSASFAGLDDQLEIICVDDGSPDMSAKLIADIQNKSSLNIKLLRFENAGSWVARLRGLDAADGEYICFVDADDYVDESYFADFLNALDDQVDVVVSGFKRTGADDGNIQSVEMSEVRKSFVIQEHPELLLTLNTALFNKLIRSSLLKSAPRPNVAPAFLEDGAMLQLAYVQAQGKVAFTGTANYNYMVHSGSQIASLKSASVPAIFDFLTELKVTIDKLATTEAYKDQLAALYFCHLGISLLHRMPEADLHSVYKKVYAYLNKTVPRWKNNPYLKLSFALRQGKKFLSLAIAHKLFKIHLIVPALRSYSWLIRTSKHEIKW